MTNGGMKESFIWHNAAEQSEWTEYRLPTDGGAVRSIDDIAPEELRAAAAACTSDDHPLEVARMFGTRRLSNSARVRIVEAIRP